MTDETGRPGPDPAIDLVGEADFSLGASRVSPSMREVVRAGFHEMLEPRIMQVLVALYQANGRVVSRDELITRCWEGRIVGEDAINRAIGRLRRLSEADGGASFIIETIPRIGFRLVVGDGSQPVGELARPISSGGQSSEKSGVTELSPWRLLRRRRLVIGAGMLLVVGGAATWLLWPTPRWTVESSRPFVSTLALEGEPAFSPNGAMLAYTSGPDTTRRKIYVRNLAGGDGIKVSSDAYDDVSPSWSSDGARLAYVAQQRAKPCRIMVTTFPAGEAREAGRCAQAETSSVAWQPNSSFLYYTDQMGTKGTAIFRLDLDTGARLRIVALNRPDTRLGDLRCSPDGKSLLYIQQRGQAQEPVVIRDLANGTEKILTGITGTTGINGSAAWSEDSSTVLTAIPSGVGSKITAFPVDGAHAYVIYTLALKIGHLATGGGLLAMESINIRTNLARAATVPATQPEIIDAANGTTASPTFAPDGTLAFLSNRLGTNAVWIMKPGAAPTQLFDFGLLRLSRVQFSPDGTRLAVAAQSAVGILDGMTVRILTVDGANVASLNVASVGFGTPTWTLDGKGMVVSDPKSVRAFRIAIDNPEQRSPVAAAGWGGVTIRDNGIYASRADKPGLWRIDHGTVLINDKYPTHFGPPIAFRGDDVLIPDFDVQDGARILAQPLAGGPDRVIAYAPGATTHDGFQSAFAVNPKTAEIIYVALVQRDANIDLLTLAKR
jgi:Tol biopolymer transport system component/DNA-binding winged helix-turn-helix (wHTH) protein